jgi:hypothetical protein
MMQTCCLRPCRTQGTPGAEGGRPRAGCSAGCTAVHPPREGHRRPARRAQGHRWWQPAPAQGCCWRAAPRARANRLPPTPPPLPHPSPRLAARQAWTLIEDALEIGVVLQLLDGVVQESLRKRRPGHRAGDRRSRRQPQRRVPPPPPGWSSRGAAGWSAQRSASWAPAAGRPASSGQRVGRLPGPTFLMKTSG